MWLDRPPLCAEAQKAVRNTIDGTLKSCILICVRWYSLINIPSRAHRTQKSFLSLCSLVFAPFSADNKKNVSVCEFVSTCVRIGLLLQLYISAADRNKVCV